MSDREERGEDVAHPFDRSACPFCGESLDARGTGFLEHLRESPECRRELDSWRDRRGHLDDSNDTDDVDTDE